MQVINLFEEGENKFEKHHIEILNVKARWKVITWHRKSRKTTFLIKECIRKCLMKKGVIWFVQPFYNQLKRNVWEDPQMLDRYLPDGCKKNGSELSVKFPNGSVLQFIGANKPESLRGAGLMGMVLDEFDDIRIEVWNYILRPMLVLTRGWAIFAGTYKGLGNLYNFRQRAEQEREVNWWASDELDIENSGLLPEEEVEDLKNAVKTGELPQVVYDQEYMCKAISGGSSLFRRINENLWEGDLRPIRKEHKFQLGVDLAKLSDFTVITAIRLHDWAIGKPDRFQQLDYPMIEARIESNWRKYNMGVMRVESNAMGESVCDHLQIDRDIAVERFTTTEKTKEMILKNLSILIETDQVKIPNDPVVIRELQSMRYERDEKTKKIKIISSIEHDDIVMSMALAAWELKKIPLPIISDWTQEQFKQGRKRINREQKSTIEEI